MSLNPKCWGQKYTWSNYGPGRPCFSSKASTRGRAGGWGSQGRGERQEGREQSKSWNLLMVWADIVPSAFSYYALGNEKKKIMKGGRKSQQAFKTLLYGITQRGFGKQGGLHKWEQVRSCRGNYSAYVSAVGKSLSCREYSKLVPNGLGFCHMVLIIRLKLHCHAFSVNEMDG